MKILIINGPNLNMLGMREPEIYGHETLEQINANCKNKAEEYGFELETKQSNHEGELVTWIQQAAQGDYTALMINAGAYTHTSVAIYDALKLLKMPIIEVHMSDPEEREKFRHHSYIKPLAKAVIKGKGADSYYEAIEKINEIVKMNKA